MERLSAVNNADIALKNGADGVFLVGSCPHLVNIYLHVRQHLPKAWIGLRFKGVCPNTETSRLLGAVRRSAGLNALWTDKLPGSRLDIQVPVFGSMSLNYCKEQGAVQEFQRICNLASKVADVAVVFGPEKGTAPSMALAGGVHNLFETVRKEQGSKTEIAIAGGVDEGNLFRFIHSADIFIVGTHISEERENGWSRILPEKVAHLAERIHG